MRNKEISPGPIERSKITKRDLRKFTTSSENESPFVLLPAGLTVGTILQCSEDRWTRPTFTHLGLWQLRFPLRVQEITRSHVTLLKLNNRTIVTGKEIVFIPGSLEASKLEERIQLLDFPESVELSEDEVRKRKEQFTQKIWESTRKTSQELIFATPVLQKKIEEQRIDPTKITSLQLSLNFKGFFLNAY